jgi:hypothetical protein
VTLNALALARVLVLVLGLVLVLVLVLNLGLVLVLVLVQVLDSPPNHKEVSEAKSKAKWLAHPSRTRRLGRWC